MQLNVVSPVIQIVLAVNFPSGYSENKANVHVQAMRFILIGCCLFILWRHDISLGINRYIMIQTCPLYECNNYIAKQESLFAIYLPPA